MWIIPKYNQEASKGASEGHTTPPINLSASTEEQQHHQLVIGLVMADMRLLEMPGMIDNVRTFP